MQLSPHFTLEELTVTQQKGINNIPDEQVIKNLKQLAFKLETVRSLLHCNPIVISSGFRCLELNRLLGSKDTSAHVRGQAADFVCSGFGSPEKIFDHLRQKKDFKYDQLIFERLRGKEWIHLGLKENPEEYRQQCFIMDESGIHL